MSNSVCPVLCGRSGCARHDHRGGVPGQHRPGAGQPVPRKQGATPPHLPGHFPTAEGLEAGHPHPPHHVQRLRAELPLRGVHQGQEIRHIIRNVLIRVKNTNALVPLPCAVNNLHIQMEIQSCEGQFTPLKVSALCCHPNRLHGGVCLRLIIRELLLWHFFTEINCTKHSTHRIIAVEGSCTN